MLMHLIYVDNGYRESDFPINSILCKTNDVKFTRARFKSLCKLGNRTRPLNSKFRIPNFVLQTNLVLVSHTIFVLVIKASPVAFNVCTSVHFGS